MFSESPADDTYKCGTLVISKAEYANAEKINQIIDYLIDVENK